MNGGVTYHDMEERKEALAFMRWLERLMPYAMRFWRRQYVVLAPQAEAERWAKAAANGWSLEESAEMEQR
jgi:hypothetical protein